MISLTLTKAEAILVKELIQESVGDLIECIENELAETEEAEKLHDTVKNNYVTNLENEVKRLEDLLKNQEKSPYGIKKDGTPRAKPGRKTLKYKKAGK